MIVGKAIYYLLTNATGVTDIVSTRVYPEVAQQDAALPYIVYNVTNNEPTDTKPEPSKLDTAQVEVNIYSDSYTEAIDLAVAVRAALDRVKGTYNGVNVQSIQYLNEIIDFDEPQRAYNINADYDVRISRSGFEIAQGSPITGVELGELSDVNVAGATDNQVLSYDAATDTWIPANDGGAIALDDLSDVDAGEPEAGQLLSYGQGDWTTIAQDELEVPISSVTGLQAALDATPDALDDLTDVKIVGTPTDGDALVYSSGFWSRGTAGASTLGALTDVNLTTPSTGAYLQFDGNDWIDSVITLPSVPSTYYHNRYATEAETLRAGATATVELYYTAQADGDGYAESASSDTATAGYDIRRKLYYSEAAQADCDSGTWVQFADIADDTTFSSAKATLLAYLKERTGGTVPISLKMTWEEVAEAPAFTGLLNESYGSGAAAAYSVRRLNGNYTGAAIQVERSSDNTTQDIGFDSNGDLDESALTTFCTGTTCKVRSWYDQSQSGGTGSGNDAVQTTHANQPTIYTGGAIVKENGRVAINWGANIGLSLSSDVNNVQSTFSTRGNDQGGNQVSWLYGHTSNDHYHAGTNQYLRYNALSQIQNGANRINGTSHNFLTGGRFTNVQVLISMIHTSNVGSINQLTWQRTNLARSWNGNLQEILLYTSDKSTDRTSIESNIGDYFTQNTPLLDTYTGAAAAYSLRKLRTAYTGNAVTVRRASDNFTQGIGFNVFGELDTVSLAAFCGASDGFVDTWHDQSGNGNDATQGATAKQPKIYDSSTGVVTENGKPAVEFDGAGDRMTSAATVASDFTTSVVLKALTASQSNQWLLQDTSGADMLLRQVTTNFGWYDGTVYDIGTAGTDQHHIFVTANTTGSVVSFDGVDQSISGISNNGYTDLEIGGDEFSRFWHGRFQEIVIWGSYQATNRTGIETNLNTFYSIYA